MKKISAILACLYIAAHLTACTSNESREDDPMAPAEETAAVDSELEKVDGGSTAAVDESQAGFGDEQLPEQALGEAAPTDKPAALADAAPAAGDLSLDAPAASGAPADALAMEAPPTEPQLDLSAPPPELTPEPSASTLAEAPPAEAVPTDATSLGIDPGTDKSSSTNMAGTTSTDTQHVADSSAPKASLKKTRDAPFTVGGQLLNSVYVARSGDDYKKIAKAIFGDAKKSKSLKSGNPAIAKVNVGDKVYYNSPNRPTDDTAMKTYQEDTGAAPEVYVAREGDDLKKVARSLLGSTKNWKEPWVTNTDLESKGALVAGTEIRYFKQGIEAAGSGGGMDGAKIAKNDVAPFSPADQMMPPPLDQMAPPPADQMAANSMPPPPADQMLPPPPDMGGAASGTTVAELPPPPAEMAPPPPPPVEQAPPPPPPMEAKPPSTHLVANAAEGMSNDDLMMGLGAAGILAAGIAGMMVIRKRRQQKEMAAAFGDTQIGAS